MNNQPDEDFKTIYARLKARRDRGPRRREKPEAGEDAVGAVIFKAK